MAIEEGWTLEWARPQVIAPYLAKGVDVTAGPSATKVDLKQPLEAQPK